MANIDSRDFFSWDAIDNPYPLYARMRTLAPVCQIGDTRAFLVSTQGAVEEAVKRHDEFSAQLKAMLVCSDDGQPRLFDLAAVGTGANVISNADEPDHAIHRKLMLPPLKAARIAELEPELRFFARERVNCFRENGGGNICPILSEALPAYVVIKLLALGENALEAVQRWAMMGGDFLAGRLDSTQMEKVFIESLALYEFLSKHFDGFQSLPRHQRGNSLSATLAGGLDDGLITREQAIGILIILFGAAGESTASLLGSAIRLLAMDSALQNQLRATPELIPNFIEEVVRLETPFKFHYRHVNHDTSLCGTSLKAGDLLLLGWSAANRDPAIWEEPDTLRLNRPRPERHLGFGYGIHFCIGAPLARLEVRIALEELLAGTQQIALQTDKPFAFAPSIFVRRLQHLHLQIA